MNRITRAGAIYDLVATIGFATPWTARLVLHMIGGTPFDEGQLLFPVLLGTVITMWSLLRILRPSRELLLADTLTRVPFAIWMVRAVILGAPSAAIGFAALELFWLGVQAYGLWRYRN